MTSTCSGVSIIICSKDRHSDLNRTIASVRQSGVTGRTAEIVVVEETDTPRTAPGVRYVPIPRRNLGFGYARNVARKEAGGDVLLFIDDDCVAEQGWAEALIEPFSQNPEVLGVAGAVLVRHCGLLGYAENIVGFPGGGLRYLMAAHGRVVPTTYLSTCNCAYRRTALEQVGGFPEDARFGGEDALVAERVAAIGPCCYMPRAVVYHRTRDDLGAIFRWFVRRGYSEMATREKHVDQAAFFRYVLRSSWTVRTVGLLAVIMVVPLLALLLPGILLLYYGAMLWRFRFARQFPMHRRAWWLVPLVKLTMDFGAEVGRWKYCLAGKA
ncbi:MAG: glycosyltransferase family 2 protein [Nitrospiraceae bacterium]